MVYESAEINTTKLSGVDGLEKLERKFNCQDELIVTVLGRVDQAFTNAYKEYV